MTEASGPDDFNALIIEQFRANGGVLQGDMASMAVLLLHHVGRQSGAQRVSPLAYQKVDSGWAIFGSYAGRPKNPAWYYNLLASPQTTIEVGTKTVPVTAREAVGQERDAIWAVQKQIPAFAGYEASAAPRVIPVVVLEPAES